MGGTTMDVSMMGWLMMFGASLAMVTFVGLLVFGIYWLVKYLRRPQ